MELIKLLFSFLYRNLTELGRGNVCVFLKNTAEMLHRFEAHHISNIFYWDIGKGELFFSNKYSVLFYIFHNGTAEALSHQRRQHSLINTDV